MPLAQETVQTEVTTSVEEDTFVQEGDNITIAASLIPRQQRDNSPAKQIQRNQAEHKLGG